MTTAEKIAEEIFRIIERERRILKSDLVEAAERILKMELAEGFKAAPPLTVPIPSTTNKLRVTLVGGGGAGGNAAQPYPVPFFYDGITWTGGI